MAMSMGEQAEEGVFGALIMGTARPVVSLTSQAEEARPEPPSVQVAVSAVGQMEGAHPRHPLRMWRQGRPPCPSHPPPLSLEELL